MLQRNRALDELIERMVDQHAEFIRKTATTFFLIGTTGFITGLLCGYGLVMMQYEAPAKTQPKQESKS